MKRIALFLAAGLFALWLPNANAQKARVSEFTVGADIDAQGAVAKTEVEPSVTPGIAAALEQAIRYWRFVPAQHDGMAVPAHTFITAKLEILPIADGKLDLRISYVRHGPKSDLFDVLPSYPRDAIRARQQGMVVLLGELPVRGKATVTLVKCAVTQQDCGSLRRATEDWFLHGTWTPETVDGQPVPAQARSFVTFRLTPVTPGTHKPLDSEPGITHEEHALLQEYGFDDNHVADGVNHLSLSSALKPLVLNPVLMHVNEGKKN